VGLNWEGDEVGSLKACIFSKIVSDYPARPGSASESEAAASRFSKGSESLEFVVSRSQDILRKVAAPLKL